MSTQRWNELLERDSAARRLAQGEFVRPVVLEAGAGTGKTATLVARIVAWLLGPGWERADAELRIERPSKLPSDETVATRALNGVVAITFTEAAAGEMAARVGQTLTAVANGQPPDWLHEASLTRAEGHEQPRARALLACLDRLVVSTIHAYCRRLLSLHPLEAGLHPAFAVDAQERALEQTVREVLSDAAAQALGPDPDADWIELAVAGNGPAELAECVEDLIRAGIPPPALDADPFPPAWQAEVFGELAAAAQALATLASAPLASARQVDVAQEVMAAVEAAASLKPPDPPTIESLDELCRTLRQLWAPRLVERLDKWAKEGPGKTEARALAEAAAELPGAAARLLEVLGTLVELHPGLLACARRVVRPLLAAAREQLRTQGQVTFTDLLRQAHQLVRRHPEVARRWRMSARQLLVDEFQDTDRLQCDLVAALALEGPADERPGLFVVGDPKQSIYGWRNADLGAYHAFVDLVLSRSGGIKAELCVSFRSVPPILEAVESWVGPHLVEQPGIQAAFQTLAPCERNASRAGFKMGRWAPVELWVSSGDGSDDDERVARSHEASDLEASALAADLIALHRDAGVEWNEIGILLRAGGDLDRYLAALRDAGVPFAVERDRSYYQRREILDAAALVRAVVDPSDHVALFAWLRSPAVGVPDAAWLPLWRRGFPARITALAGPDPAALAELEEIVIDAAQAIPKDVPGMERIAGWPHALVAALEQLATLRRSFACDPGVRFVARMRQLTLIEPTAAARFLGRFRVANLRRFFRHLAAALDDGQSDPATILRILRQAVREGREEEEARPVATVANAVRVMTIHRAKGLDFEHVYVVQTHKQPGLRRTVPTGAWETSAGWEYLLLGAPTPGWQAVMAHREVVAEAEAVRTLYVAMTRARQRLVVAGRWPDAGKAARRGSHLALLAASGELPQAGPEGFGDSPLGRFVWLRPGEGPATSRPAGMDTGAEALLSLARKDALRLVRLRQAAGQRMARPFALAASAEAHRALDALLSARHAEEETTLSPQPPAPAGAATLIGAAVHWALETMATDQPFASALQGSHEGLAAWVRRHAPAHLVEPVIREAQDVLAGMVRSPLGAHWDAIRPHIVGRELALLLPPEPTDAIGFVAGQIDLVYRHPENGGLVVVDYKTDRVEKPDEIAARAAAYASQCATYARALRASLQLTESPRWELWFVRAGELVTSEDPEA